MAITLKGNDKSVYAGRIEANQGIEFGDGTVQITAAEGGGGGDSTGSGADAWASVDADGTLVNGLNVITEAIGTTGLGYYRATFTKPMPDSDYAITFGGDLLMSVTPGTKTATGFDYSVYTINGTNQSQPNSFAVFATNAAPPKGTTGTDAWLFSRDRNNAGSYNANLLRTGEGEYQVSFLTPLPIANYAVTSSTESGAVCAISNRTVNGFDVSLRLYGTGAVVDDIDWSVSVNATNAQLPNTVTQEQIEAAVNNPGLSAWGNVAIDGTFQNGNNVASVERVATGRYEVVFQTPMPDANYSISGASKGGFFVVSSTADITPQGFTYTVTNSSGSNTNFPAFFQVASTNALPPKGTTGLDAWVNYSQSSSATDGVLGGYNVTSVTKSSTGTYDVLFTTPMPTNTYAVTVTSGTAQVDWRVANQTVTGYQVIFKTTGTSNNVDVNSFYSMVAATNAQLPDTVTQEQIEAAINNPGCSAWGNIAQDGTLNNGLNCTTSRVLEGRYQVTFTTPMPNADYAVVSTGYQTSIWVDVASQTVNGFEVNSGAVISNSFVQSDGPVSFAVFATNALPPKGTTGLDAWVNAKGGSSTADEDRINSSYNIASVVRNGTGDYSVTFTTPMPTDTYSVVSDSRTIGAIGTPVNLTTDGFGIKFNTYGGSSYQAIDSSFLCMVSATNAQLPNTVTQEQIDAATVNAIKAKVNFAGASQLIRNQFNVTSITRVEAGRYRVNFTNPMPNADYVGVATSTGFMTAIDSATTTYFEVSTFDNNFTRSESSIVNVVIY